MKVDVTRIDFNEMFLSPKETVASYADFPSLSMTSQKTA